MIDGEKVKIAGIAKGSGMIAPDMATMLAFVATDAAISPAACRRSPASTRAPPSTASPSTATVRPMTPCCCSPPASPPRPRISRAGDRRLADFREKLEAVLLDLALQLVRDGEGATKFVKINVTGAESPASARKIARTIAESPLVKTAFAGEDANWGRIVMAVGRADEPVDRDRVKIQFGPLIAAQDGLVSPTYDEAKMSAYMKKAGARGQCRRRRRPRTPPASGPATSPSSTSPSTATTEASPPP
jgi:glutamate N-acetyltransferase/amino-acid N-acetyltransferase